jgi:hypothetical protein
MKKTSEHPKFDVFLSHSSIDKPWVTQLKNDLLRYGVSVWLDKDEIRPGDLFAEVLEQALDNCRTVALVVSPEALASGWVKEEYYHALSLAKTRESPRQVIPVILRDAQIPGFLQSRNWVDFRDKTAYSQNLWKLVWGITGQKPERVLDLSPLISLDTGSGEHLQLTETTAQVTILLERDIHKFISEQEDFITTLSLIVNISQDKIRILQVTQGSVLVTLEMPEKAAQLLISMFLSGDPVLKTLDIVKVELQQFSIIDNKESVHHNTTDEKSRMQPSISILFLAADPTNASRLRLGEEFREIQEKLKLAKLRDNFRLELPQLSVRPADISQAMLDIEPQIVHFSGHGTSTGALCFENQAGQTHLVQPQAIAALFEQFAHQVNCVVLNACFSDVQAEAIAQHIEYVIGMNQEIGDKAAIAFAIGFYQALGAGRTVEEAYKLGCVQIRLQGIAEYLTPVIKSFGLKILKVLSPFGSSGRTKRGIRDDTGLDITTVAHQLNVLKKNGYVSVERTNGERWVITAAGKKLLKDTNSVSSDLSQ